MQLVLPDNLHSSLLLMLNSFWVKASGETGNDKDSLVSKTAGVPSRKQCFPGAGTEAYTFL